MIRATEFGLAAVQGDEFASAMQTRIIERPDLSGRRTRDDQRFSDDLIDLIVADVRNFLFTAGKLPDAAPDAIDLFLEIGAVVIAGNGNRIGTDFAHLFLAQVVR